MNKIMATSGKLVLKGGFSLKPDAGVKKKKKKSKTDDGAGKSTDGLEDAIAGADGLINGESAPAKPHVYEEDFLFETERLKQGKARSTPWGNSYRAPPAVLHGYDKVVKGENPSERLDLRCAGKADRMCK